MIKNSFITRQALLTLLAGLIFGMFALSASADLVVLQYHHISDSTPSATSTSVSLFKAQLEMIEETGLTVVPLEAGTTNALAGENADENQLAITFDDAYESIYTTAAPILASYNYPYTIFVSTAAVGGSGFMTWKQLAELATLDKVTIANHSI